MITVPDPTPEQRIKMLRTARSSSITHAVLGVAFLALSGFDLWRGRRGWYAYAMLVLGVGYIVLALFTWLRAKRYA